MGAEGSQLTLLSQVFFNTVAPSAWFTHFFKPISMNCFSFPTTMSQLKSFSLSLASHFRENTSVGTKGRPTQDGPIWCEHYFKLKAIQTQQIQKKLFTSSSTACFPETRDINKDSSLPKKLLYIIGHLCFPNTSFHLPANGLSPPWYPQTLTPLLSSYKPYCLFLEFPCLCGFSVNTLLNLIFLLLICLMSI